MIQIQLEYSLAFSCFLALIKSVIVIAFIQYMFLSASSMCCSGASGGVRISAG